MTLRVFAIFLLNLLTLSLFEAHSTRIIGGSQANAGQFPFIAAIHVTTPTSKIFCSGALHGNQWIITAGQCVNQATSFTIHLGSNHVDGTDSDGVTLATSTYILHPDYNPATLDNDIGLIHLRAPVEHTDYIKPIYNVPVANTPPNWSVIGLGWGQTTNDDPELSQNLNWVILDTLQNEECRITYGSQITDNMICAVGNYNEGTCVGDTGSPLVYLLKYGNPQLVGVGSFLSGNGCESTDPSGYTRVYQYSDWITNITEVPPK